MKIKILKGGTYMGADLRAVTCAAGHELETAMWYGMELVEQGKAVVIEEPSAPKPVKKKPAKPKAKAKERTSMPSNPFLEK